jgi:hypothetical protein
MRWKFHVLISSVIALTVGSSAGATASTHAGRVSVHVQRKPSFTGNVHISFRPTDRLPEGGYYYAVMVLRPYRHYTRASLPPCATSSNMERTDYGYPQSGRPVRLTLTPAKSTTGHWCPGGIYTGAIYAVPHTPPCEGKYPCRSEPYEPPGSLCPRNPHPCFGIVKPRGYAYPNALPTPLAKGTRITDHFRVIF